MADVGKVPGMRKNGEPVRAKEDIDELSGQELVDALNEEMRNWASQGLDPALVNHDLNKIDVQVQTMVWVLIDKGILTEQELNERYQRRMLEKLTQVRSGITKAQITQGIQKSGIILPGKG